MFIFTFFLNRKILSRVTEGTRETGREKGMTTKGNFGQRMKISKGTGAVFGRRNREKINLVEERIKGEGVEKNRRRRGKSRDLRIKVGIPSELATRKANLMPKVKRR